MMAVLKDFQSAAEENKAVEDWAMECIEAGWKR